MNHSVGESRTAFLYGLCGLLFAPSQAVGEEVKIASNALPQIHLREFPLGFHTVCHRPDVGGRDACCSHSAEDGLKQEVSISHFIDFSDRSRSRESPSSVIARLR